MAIVLFDHSWIIARLKDQVTSLKLVGGAADFDAAAESLKQKPAAFVLPNSERANQSTTGTMAVSQENTVRFAVVLAVQNLRDARGENAQADLLSLRTDIMSALLGWEPDEDADFKPIEFSGGRLLQLADRVLWWQDEFVTAHLLRSV
ncbi:phage tail terminator protein [Nitrosomonas oligotropha]|uniref:phage tail terminator protein n=1 Tax=Nitrosomonas oligotropha TaxID=42354 RepID=UPI001370F589|nr:hypothetical protein [Nitrosomonas oligotropha]MXS82273.1 hypothetical protein [Nitrosomonas oligotropha]